MNKIEAEQYLKEIILDYSQKNSLFSINDICSFFSAQKTVLVKDSSTGKTHEIPTSVIFSWSKTRRIINKLTKAEELKCVNGSGRRPSLYSLTESIGGKHTTEGENIILLQRIERLEERLHEIETNTWGLDLL